MTYVLESKTEFKRLEEQSTLPLYDYRTELSALGFTTKPGMAILDAGCGSGIVSRYLAQQYPQCHIFGCDFSKERISQAVEAAQGLANLTLTTQDLTALTYDTANFDAIIGRYVMHHMSAEARAKALLEFWRCLKPDGTLYIMDTDGLLLNIYPRTPFLSECLAILEKRFPVDLNMGRKLKTELLAAGFSDVHFDVSPMVFEGENRAPEIEQLKQRFAAAKDILIGLLGRDRAERFAKEYLEQLNDPATSFYWNKTLHRAQKGLIR